MLKYNIIPILTSLAIIVEIDIQTESFMGFLFFMGQGMEDKFTKHYEKFLY